MLARRLLQIGVSAALEPSAAIIHFGAHSTSRVQDFAAGQYYRSAVLAVMSQYPRHVALPTAVALALVLFAMAILTPVRMALGWRAEKGLSWYRSGAAGAVAGLFGRVVRPPRREPAQPVVQLGSRPRLVG
jgi:N-acetylglucosaminyl-diphospho-decaprenol L-rhamnosyltransferase